ncbi:MAG: cation diffusion facilitator family transporter [Lactobacillaceae bacterium]|nr:cation diffusion facilitator family transporter [Lactobacillaceae bacterium]
MMKFLLQKLAVKTRHQSAITARTSYGITVTAIGAGSNLLLFAAKIAIGLLSGSVAIVTDAINNLSDLLSSLVALIGFKIAAKKPDRSHPFGHERSETIAGFIIGIVIMFVGLQFVLTSINKIQTPTLIHYRWPVYLILVLSMALKLWQVTFYRQIGHQIKSDTLMVTAKDSLNDVYTTGAVLISAILQNLTHWPLDGYVSLGVAIYILVSAISMLHTFINDLLGHQPAPALSHRIVDQLSHYQNILGYHDLIVHQYGANTIFATVHIELASLLSLTPAYKIIDKIEHDFWHHLEIHLVCQIDLIDIQHRRTAQVYETVQAVINHYNLGLKTHDFHIERLVNHDHLIQFDLVVPEQVTISDDELLVAINHDLRKILGAVTVEVTFDHNYFSENHTLI